MNDFQDRPKAGLHNVITPDQWRDTQPDAEAIANAKRIRKEREELAAKMLQEFIDAGERKDKRRYYLLTPLRVLRDVVRFMRRAP